MMHFRVNSELAMPALSFKYQSINRERARYEVDRATWVKTSTDAPWVATRVRFVWTS